MLEGASNTEANLVTASNTEVNLVTQMEGENGAAKESTDINHQLGLISAQLKQLTVDVNTIKLQQPLQTEKSSSNEVKTTHTHQSLSIGATSTHTDPSPVSNFWSSDDILSLVSRSRSLKRITEIVPHFTEHNEGLSCNLCNSNLDYDVNLGVNFENVNSMPRPFRNLKISVGKHLKSESHLLKLDEKAKKDKANEIHISVGKRSALNCAGHAYTGYYFSAPYEMYSYSISDTFSAGGEVGTKNHSKEFPRLFLPHVYDVMKDHIVDNIIHDDLPFGIIADKVTISHRTRHAVGIRIPVYDLKYSSLTKDIYLKSASVKHHDGLSICNHMLDSVEAAGFPRVYIRKNLSGGAFDGQYTSLNIGKHMSDVLDSHTNIAWDPMHRVQLAYNDS